MLGERVRNLARALRRHYLSIGLPRSATFSQPPEEKASCRAFSIVVAVHDAPLVVKRCLDSLVLYARDCEVILVDDGSKEPITREMLRHYSVSQGWRLVVHDQALGHSRACEAGAMLATRPYICLLNSDTYVTPWGWTAILDAFEGDDGVAVVGPSTSWATTAQRLIPAMHCRHFWSDSQIVAFAQRYLKRLASTDRIELPEISGFAFFVRRDVWDHFGGFHAALHDYGNEAELCVRLRNTGWRLVWVRACYVHHFGEQSYSQLGANYIEQRKQEIHDFLAKGAGSKGTGTSG